MQMSTCTIMVDVPRGHLPDHVAQVVRGLRPKVYDVSLNGYRAVPFSVAVVGKEVHMTLHGLSGNDATTVWGRVHDDLYSHQLRCSLRAPQDIAA